MADTRGGRLGVLGTLVWDRIWHPSGPGSAGAPMEQWGGITYSLAALAAGCPPGWVVVPLLKVGSDLEEEAQSLLRGLPSLELGRGVRVVPEPNNRVELRYRDAAHRCERLTGGVPPWSWGELAPLVADLDALYVNFISGFELDLPTAQALRAGFTGPLHADLHSLFLGPAGHEPRTPRPLPRWREWLGCFDTVQMNETELALLGVGEPGDPTTLASLLDCGPSAIVVTLGAAGAAFAHRRGATVDLGTIPPPGGPQNGDPTGCGDVWGAALFTGILAGLDLRAAILRAHRAAARKIRAPRTSRLYRELAQELSRGPA